MQSENSLKNNSFLNTSTLMVNNSIDIFYVSIVQILVGLLVSYILDNLIYKHYNNKKDEKKNTFTLLIEFALMCGCIATLSFGMSKLLVYLPFPFNGSLQNNFGFNHLSNILNKNDAIMTIVLVILCKPLQSKLSILKKRLSLDDSHNDNRTNIVAYNTPKNQLATVKPLHVIKPKETLQYPTTSLPSLIQHTS
jgi:hypothetical protein